MANLVLKQGITSGFYWPIVDAETGEAPESLSGITAKAQVRDNEAPNANLLFEFTTEVLFRGVVACVVIRWTAAESMLWDWTDGYGDVVIYNDGEPIQILWQGAVVVDQVVTHE